ncbi:MAG: YciI family protein [Rhodospirillales bacterium]
MLFVIFGTDKPDCLALRQQNRPAHLAYLDSQAHRIKTAGPTLADDGTMNGSLLIVDVADRAEAEAFVANDPYGKAGLFESVHIRFWKKVLPAE